ncbi:MAG: type I 3-dehydroquinate dehydratase [Candidatus Nanohalarchaeota archaeon]|nr:MAG: type I 3-dehydroquinate dehydratase [Candidatus Nanohaloarchaeota archaeon]
MIAIPITSRTVDGALKDIEAVCKVGADVVELRLDYISGLDDVGIKRMVEAVSVSKIVTVRRKVDGGCFSGTEKERVGLLLTACRFGVDYVDVELDVDFGVFRDAGVKVICSYHNFNQTPGVSDLLAILESCVLKRPDVVKIVTMAKKYNDNVVILDFLEKVVGKDVKVVSFCMGDKGKLSRVLCTHFGSFFTFAALEGGKESAPGQVDIGVMKEFSEVLV